MPRRAKPQLEEHVETPAEERLACATHGLGAVLSVAALVVLITTASLWGDARRVVAVTVFGVSMLLLYVASTAYHACDRERSAAAKLRLKIFDHISIYFLIAGTYTPVLLVLIRGAWGWSLFGVLWAMAIGGTIFKLFFTGRYDVVSTLIYLAMGWIGVLAAGPALERIPPGALAWLVAGGLAYTGGVVFYLWDRLPFNHAVWHLFVMGGSACHFLAVLLYVAPAR
jgi:hemolysin III